ncbi:MULTISPECIES: hypothetical protein [Amycolatopsis]|uniref:Uncharacterized protein n=1 Tax=Amycolatopsis tucumanensis TaxID=401106 RepID=A0ABP7HMY3_9PSEU|nr:MULTISPECIES: hypothetical protein [Amycolatopsis]MCF6420910.1 hypothetical protein [Amycolatopsis tucumanensis]
MDRTWLGLGGLAAAAAAAAPVVRKRLARRGGTEAGRWLTVTIGESPLSVGNSDELRRTLADFGDTVEFRLTAAPGERGTEVALRPVDPGPGGALARLSGADPRQDIRRALRDLKSRLETGEVIRPDPPTTGKPTPGGAIMRFATRRAGGEGRL